MLSLSTSIEQVPHIGPIFQKKLKKLGIKTIQDLLFHFPHRYEDFSHFVPISKIKLNEICTVQGRLLEIKNSRAWRRRMTITQAIVEDKTGALKVIWFNQPYLAKTLKKGDPLFLSGKATLKKDGIYLTNPVYEKALKADLTHTGRLIPVYPETEGLSSRWIRYILKPLIYEFKKIPDPLPASVLKKHKLLPIAKALWQIHFPDSKELSKRAQERFSFEELFFIELFVLRERMKLAKEKAVSVPINLNVIKRLVSSLPFKLTVAQKKSSWVILKDMERPRPMNRLLEGDVGSGKTVVAVMVSLNIIKAGFQVAFMAPTEILAKQHFKEVSGLLSNFNLNIGLLTGKQDQFRSKKLKNEIVEISRKKLLEKAKGKISPYTKKLIQELDILIGTHALIQDKVKFGKLGLVILDEQHRFGVKQRAKLCRPSNSSERMIPHLLSMTATPIPRTLALTIYGDLDLSLLNELPKGRKKIITRIVEQSERKEMYVFIKKEIKKGRQVFVICPRIEENTEEKIAMKAVKEEYKELSENIFPDLRIEMLHGKMTPKEKEKIMTAFKNKKTDILVSTSVIEVGIDVPNATVMVIEGAERFGLAQLHQFRGRVGRGKYQSYCLLFSNSLSQKTKQRLQALITSEDGFSLAEKDLEIRGPGDFTGIRQWGIPDLMMSSLKDVFLVEKTRTAAKELLQKDPGLKKHPLLLEKTEEYIEKIHLE